MTTAQVPMACDNCGKPIGRLEKSHAHGDHVVCTECDMRLNPQPQTVAYAGPSLQPAALTPPANVQTVEATSKKWKAIQGISTLAALLGTVIFCIALKNGGSVSGMGAVLLIGGVIGFIVGRVGAWWYHG